jgi:hypothetical protein
MVIQPRMEETASYEIAETTAPAEDERAAVEDA